MTGPSADEAWLTAHTAGAPERLRSRVLEHHAAAAGDGAMARLAAAGDRALRAAMAAGDDRAAALDLLAADALITLALLHAAERTPATLAAEAASLRDRMATA